MNKQKILLQDLLDYHRMAARKVKSDAQYAEGGSGRHGARQSYQFHCDVVDYLENLTNPNTIK